MWAVRKNSGFTIVELLIVIVVGQSIMVTRKHTQDLLVADTATSLQLAVDQANDIRSKR